MLIKFIVIVPKDIQIQNHYVTYLKLIQYVNYISIKN